MRNKPLKEYYTSVKKRKGSGRCAHVSTMRKILRMIFVMLKDRKKWKYEIMDLTEDKKAMLEGDLTIQTYRPTESPAWLSVTGM